MVMLMMTSPNREDSSKKKMQDICVGWKWVEKGKGNKLFFCVFFYIQSLQLELCYWFLF